MLAGLAGFYIIRDSADPIASLLPNGTYDIPLLLQDRMFNETDGSLIMPTNGDVPLIHPYWKMQFLGDVIVVNGKAWPNLNVDKGQYLFRVLNGANARFFNFSFAIQNVTTNLMPFVVVSTDGGYLRAATTVSSLVISPGDRNGILLDFSLLAAGTVVVMRNSAPAPFNFGEAPDPASTGLIMQFTVGSNIGFQPAASLPAILNPLLATYPSYVNPAQNRTLVLVSVDDATSGITKRLLLDGQHWANAVSETPVINTTEEWTIVNLASDVHPIHLHLSGMQLVKKQKIDLLRYKQAWIALNGQPPLSSSRQLDATPYLIGSPTFADPSEQGISDVIMVGEEAATFRVAFYPYGGWGVV